MADTGRPDDPTDDGPSLEMPSFSLKRRRKAPAATEPDPEPTPEPEPEPEPEPAVVHAAPPVERPTAAIATPVPADEPEDGRPEEPVHREPRPRRELPLSGLPAAAVTGVVVGALAVLLTWVATSTCDVVRGTSSCGGGPGFLILLAVLALLAWAGAFVLDRCAVPESGSTSLLAVGIMAVLVMVFLLGSIDEWWMVIAIPVTAVVAYSASWWVTHAVVGDDARPDVTEPHDVR